MHKVKVVMPFLQLFVSKILIVLVDARFNYREPLTFEVHITPLYYKLDLIPYIEKNNTFDGKSRITICIEENIQRLDFHSFVHIQEATLHKINPYNVTIRELYVPEHLVATYKPNTIYHFKDSGFVFLGFNETIECGYYILEIKFSAELSNSTDGFILTSYENQKGELQWIVATQTRVRGPQSVFPCWDNPRFKTVFDISVRHHTNYVAFSNSKKREFEYDNSGMMWTHFKSTPPISAHCIDIIVLPFVNSDFTYVYLEDNVTLWIPKMTITSPYPKFDFAWYITKNVIKYLNEQNLVDQRNVAETNYIALRNLSHAILATPSFVLYREENITVYDKPYNNQQEINVARLIAQQITYQWILRSTNPLYWPSSSLNDVSNFLAMYILKKVLLDFTMAFWLIQSKYDRRYEISFQEYFDATTFILDMDDVIQFIMSTRTNTFCDSNEKELSLKSLFN